MKLEKIVAKLREWERWNYRIIVADSAAPENIDYVSRNLGFPIRGSKKGGGSVNQGIDLINNLINLNKFYVSPHCKETLKAYNNWCWAKTPQGSKTDKPMEEYKHIPDAVRYILSEVERGVIEQGSLSGYKVLWG